MKLRFKHQRFQAEAAKAVADVFAGQPFLTPSCRMDRGSGCYQLTLTEERDYTGWSNAELVPGLSDEILLQNLNRVQRRNQIEPSSRLEGRFNLTVEMETGVGKTYTYIKTMYELHKRYGWSKYIVVVPGIAVREGVYKSFQVTQEHFAEEYGSRLRFFIYDSSRLQEIDRFASDSAVSVMIINSQAFNARGKDARRIYMRMDEFRSRRPIDIIAGTNPIVIIDEPQSAEGKQTRESLKAFHPLMTLRYSATHRADSIYNMVYRLDAMEAYNRRLVKRIAVKGIAEIGTTATDGYVYLEGVRLSKNAPEAVIQFDCKGASGIGRRSRRAGIGFDLFTHSGELPEYRDGFVIKSIDGRDDSVEFVNGLRLCAGDVAGRVGEEQLRRIQIRETILSHLERERLLFDRGIKVLSLFFIDEVAHYRQYDAAGQPVNGIFARMFEEEYRDILAKLREEPGEDAYRRYLDAISAEDTHAGYFSIDKKGRVVDAVAGDDRKGGISNDRDAYDLIMRNKELLLERDPKRSPVRFLFSHSALREGWDNPNVFQICTLKQSGSEVRKRQEVGRGLRLCVNQDGERMDENALGDDVHAVNVLTVIASESYDSFAKGLQTELAEAVADRPGMSDGKLLCMKPENARGGSVELQVEREKLDSETFQALWEKINTRSVYTVDFDTEELVLKCVAALNDRLSVSGIFYRVESGRLEEIRSGESLRAGEAMTRESSSGYGAAAQPAAGSVRYDLVGTLADETGLTRRAAIRILTGLERSVFDQFRENPEEFILKASALINEQKALAVLRHIAYHALEERYDTSILTAPVIRGRLGSSAMKTRKHLYDYLVYDSAVEREFARELDAAEEVEVYVKLPDGFFISTPVGRYHPDWAIAFRGDAVKHAYAVVETKGAVGSLQLRLIEEAKLHCAREHFKAVSGGRAVYEAVDSFETLRQRLWR